MFVGWRCPETHSANFVTIQTHPSCRFHLAVDFLGLRRTGSSPQIINQAQDSPEQASRHDNLGQLERDVPPMSEDLGSNLDQLLANSASVGLWHKAEVRGCYILGPVNTALPTFRPECRFTVAFQTQLQAVPKVVV